MPKPRPVEIVDEKYQPTKAEVEEVIVLRNVDGTPPTVDDLVGAVTSPVTITHVASPRKPDLSRR